MNPPPVHQPQDRPDEPRERSEPQEDRPTPEVSEEEAEPVANPDRTQV
jgi:hypothetical protein